MLNKSLTDSWSFFKNHVLTISVIILPIVVPIDILTALYQYFFTSEEFVFYEQVIPIAIGFIAYPIYTVGVVFYIASIITDENLEIKTLWKLGAKFWLPYIVLSILVSIAVMFGFLLFFIPGVIFAIRYAFSDFELILNRSKPLDAMKNSWNATKEYMWVILGGYIIIAIALYVPYYLFASLFETSSISYWVLDTLLNSAYSVLHVLYIIFTFRVYELAKLKHNQSRNQNEH